MSITSLTSQWIDNRTLELRAVSDIDGATFRFYQHMQVLAIQPAGTLRVTVEPGQAPVFEVRDDAQTPAETFIDRPTLIWYAPTGSDDDDIGVDDYLIERKNDTEAGSYAAVAALAHDNGVNKYRWRETSALADATQYTYRVTPRGRDGNDGTARTFTVLMVRHPDPPLTNIAANEDLTLNLS